MGKPVRKIYTILLPCAVALALSGPLAPSAYSQDFWTPWSKKAAEKKSNPQKTKRVRTRVRKSRKAKKPAVTVGAVTLLNAEKPDQLTPGAARPLELEQMISGKTKPSGLSKNLLLAEQTTEKSTDTNTDTKPVKKEGPLGWDLKTQCTANNSCEVHSKGSTQDSIKELQAALQNIGCLAYADDPTPNWGPASRDGFKKLIERSIELLGSEFNYDYAKQGKAFTRTQFLDQVSYFKQTQRRFKLSGRTRDERKAAKSSYLNKNCAILNYETWDLRSVLSDDKQDTPLEYDEKSPRYQPIVKLRKKLKQLKCLRSNPFRSGEKVSWDNDAATAFSDYLCWSQTGKACLRQQTSSSDELSPTVYETNHSYARVLHGLMKESDEPVFCHGKTLDWDPSKTQSKAVPPINYDKEAVRRDQASILRTKLQKAGCLRRDKVKGIWGQASVSALTSYFQKLKEWGTVPKTFEVSAIEGKLFAAVVSNFDFRVTQNAYVCDPPPDHLRVCDANKALNTRGVKSVRIWGDLSTALHQALTRSETTDNLALENMSGETAKWLKNRLTKSHEKIFEQIGGLLTNIENREQFLAFSDPGSDCGRCQLVGAFRHLLSYQQFVNSTENLDPEPVTIALPDGKKKTGSPSDILSATFEDGDKKRSASIPLSEINLRMVEYAYPSILDWYKEWKKYIHSLATKRTSDELQYRHAMAGLGSVILQLKDAWNKDRQERAATKAASSAKLMALVGDYGDACKEAEQYRQTPLSLANRR